MRPEWTENNTFTPIQNSYTHKHTPMPTPSCSTLPVVASDPAFTHLHCSSRCLKTAETKKLKGSELLHTLPFLSVSLALSSFFFLLLRSLKRGNICESESCRWDIWSQVCFSLISFSSIKSIKKWVSFYLSDWKVTAWELMDVQKNVNDQKWKGQFIFQWRFGYSTIITRIIYKCNSYITDFLLTSLNIQMLL